MSIRFVVGISLAGALLLAGCGETYRPEKVTAPPAQQASSSAGDQSTNQQVPQTLKFKVGEKAKIGNVVVVVHGVKDPIQPKNEFLKPQKGNKWVGIDLEVQNASSEPALVSALAQYHFQDAENHRYGIALSGIEPKAPDGEIAPGEAMRGIAVFEVPSGAKRPYKFIFDAGIFDRGQVIVEIP